jgi:NADH pyrophosphatase NudC (nudix superfamily)
MAKSKKINLTEAKIYEDNNILKIDGYTKEESISLNLVDEIKKFIGEENLEFKLGVKKQREVKEKQPIHKYSCGCGKEIKSKEENLRIQCMDCNKPFEMTE